MKKTNNPEKLFVRLIHCGDRSLVNNFENKKKHVFFMPMGIFSLADILYKNGHDVLINHLDIESGNDLTEILDIESIDVIGFDLHWMNQSVNVLETAQLIKNLNPNIFIFLGGYSASYFAEELLQKYEQINAIIKGDGEIPIVELCNILRLNKIEKTKSEHKLEKVQNLVWRDKNNLIIFNKFSYVSNETELDKFNFANLALLNKWKYFKDVSKYWTKSNHIKNDPLFFLEIGRGCNYSCSICGGGSSSQRKINNRKCQIIRSTSSVITTIQQAVSFGFKCFFACFDFNGFNEYYIKLFRSIKQNKLDISFVYECWSLPSEKFIDALSESINHSIIALSPDSGDDKIRKMNKDIRLYYSNEELFKCIDYILSKKNISVQLWYGYFLPNDTKSSILTTFSQILNLYVRYPDMLEITYMPNNTDPSSLIHNNPDKYNMHVNVNNFDSFIKKIKDNYYSCENHKRLLCWPNKFKEIEAVNLANKIVFFGGILEFKPILSNCLNNPDFIVNLLKSIDMIDLSYPNDKSFDYEKIKTFILDVIKKNTLPNALNDELLNGLVQNGNFISQHVEYYSTEKSTLNLIAISNELENDFAF